MAEWVRYEVGKRVHRPHSRISDRKQFEYRIEVLFINEDGDIVENKKYSLASNKDIQKDIQAGKDINLTHCFIERLSIGLSEKDILYENHIDIKSIIAVDSFFDNGIKLSGAHIQGLVSFSYSRFGYGIKEFERMVFKKGVSFSQTHFFDGPISFYKTEFYGKMIQFNGMDYGDGNINFSNTTIKCDGFDMSYAKFLHGHISFKFSKLNCSNIYFTNIDFGIGNVIFDFAIFDAPLVSFSESIFDSGFISFDTTEYKGKLLDFTRTEFTNSKLNFRGGDFDNSSINFHLTSFTDCKLEMYQFAINYGDAVFRGVTLNNSIINIQSSFIKLIIIDSLMLNNPASLKDSNFNYVKMTNCTFYDIIDLTNTTIDTLILQDCLNLGCLKIKWKENNLEKAIESLIDYKECSNQHHRAAETALLLKENFRKMGRYEDEDCAYYTYMKHQIRYEYLEGKKDKHRIWNWTKFQFKKWIYERLGGYGTKPFNIFVSMPFAIGAFAAIYWYVVSKCHLGSTAFKDVTLTDYSLETFTQMLYYSAITFLTIGYGDFSPINPCIRALASFEGLIGLLLISYFTIAFSRKVLR